MKRISPQFILYFSFLYVFISLLYFNFSTLTNSFDNKLREYFFTIRGEIPTSNNVVIVDIDEKSLKQLGQWPFSRDKMAQTLINLTNAQVGIVGLDIVFAEEDRISPHKMANNLNIKGDFLNHDILFGNVVANTPTILGYFFTVNETNNNVAPKLSSQIYNTQPNNSLLKAKGVVSNITAIQQDSYSSGFFNAFANATGKLTHMPLLMQYQNKIYSSLSFEMIRIASQSKSTKLKYIDKKLIGISLDNLFIPTTINGFFNINFRGAKKSFKYLSFADIYTGNFDEKEIQGKFVLIGTSITTLADLRATVYDTAMPGVEIHANIIDNILHQDFLYKPTWALVIDALFIFTLTIILGIILLLLKPMVVFPFILLLTGTLYSYLYNFLFTKGIILDLFFPLICIISTTLLALLLKYLQEKKLSTFIKDTFSKKVSAAVVDDLLSKKGDAFSVRNTELTIFFSDIRDFTKISEKLNDPKKLITLLNLYMEPMTQKILDKRGTIDKFIGDAIMAYWNAPQECQNHADLAVTCALNQLSSLKVLNQKISEEYNLELDIGIGLNSGLCTVGEMGSQGRSDYTIIGDNVNIASRVEGLTKFFGVKLIITKQTKLLLKKAYILKELATVKVKGKQSETTLYEVIDFGSQKSSENLLYERALKLYKNSDIQQALELFLTLNKEYPSKLYQVYTNRCEDFIHHPEKEFDSIFNLDFK